MKKLKTFLVIKIALILQKTHNKIKQIFISLKGPREKCQIQAFNETGCNFYGTQTYFGNTVQCGRNGNEGNDEQTFHQRLERDVWREAIQVLHKGPALKYTKTRLKISKKDRQMVTEILTGQCHLIEHVTRIEVKDYPESRCCIKKKGSSLTPLSLFFYLLPTL